MSDKLNKETCWSYTKTKDSVTITDKEYYFLSRLVARREQAIKEGWQCSKIQNPKK